VVLRASTDNTLDDLERAVDDGVNAYKVYTHSTHKLIRNNGRNAFLGSRHQVLAAQVSTFIYSGFSRRDDSPRMS